MPPKLLHSPRPQQQTSVYSAPSAYRKGTILHALESRRKQIEGELVDSSRRLHAVETAYLEQLQGLPSLMSFGDGFVPLPLPSSAPTAPGGGGGGAGNATSSKRLREDDNLVSPSSEVAPEVGLPIAPGHGLQLGRPFTLSSATGLSHALKGNK